MQWDPWLILDQKQGMSRVCCEELSGEAGYGEMYTQVGYMHATGLSSVGKVSEAHWFNLFQVTR